MFERSLSRTKNELAEFLIRHRQKLTPADVGLPSTGRRRTPGLRREEVAALAGVGLTWYTWFEQGREIQVSAKFLLSLSYALKLDDAECSHLFLLAHKRPPPPEARYHVTVAPLIQQLLDDLHARPSYVLNLRWDVVAWNVAADSLFGFSQRPRDTRNFLRIIFSDPEMRRRMPAWHDDALQLLAQFRYDFAVAPDDAAMLALVEDLKLFSPSFEQAWQMTNGHIAKYGISSVENSSNSRADFSHEMLIVDQHTHLKMVVYFSIAAP
ncbi:helix-turn-helix transcriptional regulator [Pantoea dispersa]|uniref:helix-turn-helix transcriptional regulator n=1 Tax=Pantoea dispersa TaxID=59814 RepID=UPI001CA6C872|nr:helix-turn-helix transcriptional regulator [Pantoea dispersa]QZY97665.1 helix-turn-helix transcriptional regulator [Pantoea dispersa]